MSSLFNRATDDLRGGDQRPDRRGPPSRDFHNSGGPGGHPYRRDGPAPFRRGGPGGGNDAGPFRGRGPENVGGAGGPSKPLVSTEPVVVVDREKTCPLLIRVFCKPGSHHRLEDFAVRGKEPGADAEIQIYTWMDATLRELSDLIKEVKPAARGRMTRLSFAFVYPDKRGRNVMRQVGIVHCTRGGEDDNKALKSLGFQTGDFIDVAVLM